MLNISTGSISHHIRRDKYKALQHAENLSTSQLLLRILGISFLVVLVILFLPWTQTVRSEGKVTSLNPGQRPQTIQSIIGGRIEEWHVQEGDFVAKGDTILHISEVKDEYFDPKLLENTQRQLESKEATVGAYMEKVKALDSQVDALVRTSALKLQQVKNKVRQATLKIASDSIEYEAAKVNFRIAEEQLARMEKLYEQGLKSLTDLETRRLTLQKAQAEMIAKENDLLTSQNEIINAQVELASVQNQYREKVSKSESEKYTAMSDMYDAEMTVTKMQNQYMNYSIRTGLYYITAPQDGYITQAISSGIGETVKEGEALISIMPASYQLAVEMYVKPIDLPLLEKGQDVRIQFDGWPAIVFSGWPNTSFGTFGGQVVAIDNFIGPSGKYRVLVAPQSTDHPWPEQLRVGAGTKNMALLKNVPVWYELWRQINGFPPDFYHASEEDKTKGK